MYRATLVEAVEPETGEMARRDATEAEGHREHGDARAAAKDFKDPRAPDQGPSTFHRNKRSVSLEGTE